MLTAVVNLSTQSGQSLLQSISESFLSCFIMWSPTLRCDSSSEMVGKLLTHPGSEHSNKCSWLCLLSSELSDRGSWHLLTRVSLQSKNLLMTRCAVLSWDCENNWSKGNCLPPPFPYDLQTRTPFSSNWKLCSLLKPSIFFTSDVFLVSSTAQMRAIVPITDLSDYSALFLSAAVRISCRSSHNLLMHNFIGCKILSHTSLPYCGSE